MRGDNDLVWIGRAANYAAKLTELNWYRTNITGTVYKDLDYYTKYPEGNNIWVESEWSSYNNLKLYKTDYCLAF